MDREISIAPMRALDPLTKGNKLNVLILCDFNFLHIGTVRDHLEAFRQYSRNTVCIADANSASRLDVDLSQFDVVVLHYTLIISMQEYLPVALAQKIHDFTGYKVLFIQDEYRWVDRTAAAIADLGIDLIYTVVNEDAVDQVYRHPSIRHVRRITTLTGFVPEELLRRNVLRFDEREIDVGYRARRVPAWLGSFSQEKWLIGVRFKQEAEAYGLVCDIEHDESRRLYADKWITFVSSCKAMLGTESGASFIDFSGEVQQAVEVYVRANPDADFAEIRERFLKSDGETIIQVISPRCFEAAALRTLMILYPGGYSGALQPWRHYVPLERDHSNIDEIVAVLREPGRAQEIIDNAYREVALNPKYSFKTMVEEFDRDLDDHVPEPLATTVQHSTSEPGASLTRSAIAIKAFKRQVAKIHRKEFSVPANRSVAAIKAFERLVERTYRTRQAPIIKFRQIAYLTINRIICAIVPENRQMFVREYIKVTARRLGLLRSQG